MSELFPYDPGECAEAVSDVIDLMTELKYVDAAVGWIEAQRDPETDGAAYEVEIGRTYPFTFHYDGPGINWTDQDPAHVRQRDARLRELATRATSWGENKRSLWSGLLKPIENGDLAGYVAAIDQIAASWESVRPAVADGDWSGLSTSSGHWRGQAADSFATYFLGTAAMVHTNHGWALNGLSELVARAQSIHALGEASLMNVFKPARTMLRRQLQQRQRTHQPEPALGEFLALVSTVAGLTSLAAVAAPPIAAGLSAISGVTGYAAGQVPEKDLTAISVEVTHAGDVAAEVESTLDRITEALGVHYDALEIQADRLQGYLTELSAPGIGGRSQLVTPRPGFLEDPDPSDTFYHETRP